MQTSSDRKANKLIHSASPYLLQHAYNPVDWHEWNTETLQKAISEDKPLLLSIGYSACHWCHVMERESFENEQIAELMNQYFVCIKVDREERPDVDAIYMDAVQAMGLQGGWPLNAFLTPDAKPFYAGTYFPAKNWANLLARIAQIFQDSREELENSAQQFQEAISVSELKKYGMSESSQDFQITDLDEMFDKLAPNFDMQWGGMQKAPKFPMPSIYAFLLQYAHTTLSEAKKQQALAQTFLTLRKIAEGGIYDQIGGGFARYSVDSEWFAPHFEKMLYDNGQLISLYAEAYSVEPNSFFKTVVYESIDFVERELMSEEGGFYSALDADSEGVEGKFYIWTQAELEKIFTDKNELDLFSKYYHTKTEGNWEHGNNILHKLQSDESFAEQNHLSLAELESKAKAWKKTLLGIRAERIRPNLDDKILTSWNGLMLTGLLKAYRVFEETKFLDLAMENAYFLKNKVFISINAHQTALWHNYKNGKASITAYLEDYAAVIEAFTALYQVNFDMLWLKEAEKLMNYALANFFDETEGMFFFTDTQAEKLIARKKEIFDNVIPASNSAMAKNLYTLGIILDKSDWIEKAQNMLGKVRKILLQNVEYLANWGQLYASMAKPTAEIVLVGEDYLYFRKQIDKKYFPNKVLLGTEKPSNALPLLENRTTIREQTAIYICYNKTCQLPITDVHQVWELLLPQYPEPKGE